MVRLSPRATLVSRSTHQATSSRASLGRYFGGCPLSPGSRGLSPLHRGHPSGFPSTGCGPPRACEPASPYLGVDHRVSGPIRVTLGPFETRSPHPKGLRDSRFPCASGADPLKLATRIDSLASDSRLTARRRYPDSYYRLATGSFAGIALSRRALLSPAGFRYFSLPVRGAFQLSLTVLVRYRSRDVFSLGGW